MKYRSIVAVASGLAVLLGAWIALGGFGPLEALLGRTLPSSGSGSSVDRWAYSVLAVARTAGAAIAALGVVVLATAWTRDRRMHRWSGLLGGGFVFVIVLIQQMAIWESTMGWILVATLGFLTLAIGLAMRGDGGMEESREVA